MSSRWWLAVAAVAVGCSADAGTAPPASLSVPAVPKVESATTPTSDPSVEPPAEGSSAVGSETTDQAVTPCGDVEGSGTIVVWEVLGGVAVGESFARLVDQFHAEQTSIRIERRNFEGGSEEMLETLAATDPAEWPDIVIAQPQALRRLIDSGRIVPPSVCGDVEQTMGPMLPVVRGAFSFDDQLRAVPFGISTPILLFDAAEFRAAGLDPASPPRTLEDLASASRQIVDSQASPYGLVVYDWFGNFLINQGAAQRGDVVVQPDNGRSNGPATVDFTTPANVAAMEWLVEVVDTGGGVFIGGIPGGLENLFRIIQPDDGGTMTIQTSGSLGDLIDVFEAGSFPGVELGVGPMPGPDIGGLVGGNGFWLIDHGDPERLRASFDAVSWMVLPDHLADFVVATGYIPPSISVASEPAVVERWDEYPQLRVGFDQLISQTGDAADVGPVYGPSVEVDYAFYRLANRVLSEGVPVPAALSDLTTDVQQLIDKYDAIVNR